MAIKQSHNLGGRLSIIVDDISEKSVRIIQVDNLITIKGKMLLAELLRGDYEKKPSLYIAIGSSDTPANEENMQLNECLDKIKADMKSIDTQTIGEEKRVVARVEGVIQSNPATEDQQLKEAGIFIEIPGKASLLYNHVTFPVITRTKNIDITFSWELFF